MDRASLAKALGGIQYPTNIGRDIEQAMKRSGLVAVFGASDDLMEFRGAIDDEIGAYEGTTAYLNRNGLLQNECEDDDCPYFNETKKKASTIRAIWDMGGISWQYKTDIPHSTFEVKEDGETYCIGIVFSLSDVK